MVKRSRITSYLGIISIGLVIIPGILLYFLEPDYSDIIVLPGIFLGFVTFPSIVCSYFDLKVKKQRRSFYSPPERQSMGRILSLCYGVAFLFLGIVMSVALIITSELTIITKFGLLYVPWIIIGILGIVGAIIYRDTPRNLSPDEIFKRRKIGFITVMMCIIILLTMMLLLNTTRQYYRTLNVNQDAYIYEYLPDTNYGQENQIFVGNYELGKAEAYYQFDISDFSNGWTDAYLEVKFNSASYPVNVGVCIIYESWDEMSITWNNKPNHTTRYGCILCDGFDFHVPVKPNHFINNEITICLYGIGAESDGYLLGNSKEGASNDDDIPLVYLEYKGIDPNYFIGYLIAYILIVVVSVLYLKYAGRFSYPRTRSRMSTRRETIIELERLLGRRRTPPLVNRPIPDPRLHLSELYKPRKIFKINELVDLRLIGNRTYIFVNNKRLMVCAFLLINIPKDRIKDYDEIKSIDEAAEVLDRSLERTPPYRYKISPEEEFTAHCSNIQAFFENGLNTNILHSNIAFPLLKELVQQGYEPAQKVFKEEIIKRFNEGTFNSRRFLYIRGYLSYLSEEEKQALNGYKDFMRVLPERTPDFMNFHGRIRELRELRERFERRARGEVVDIPEHLRFPDSNFKIVIFGDVNVGKNTLNQKFITTIGPADPIPIIGVRFAVKTMIVNHHRIRLQIWNISSEERFRFLAPTYFTGANGGIFIYDITNYASLIQFNEWLSVIRTRFRENQIFPIIFAGNKADLSGKREVPKEKALRFAKSKGAGSHIECSFKTGKNVEKMFERLAKLMLKRRNLQ